MICVLKRCIISNAGILGKLYQNNKVIAYTLEKPWLNNIRNHSSIPTGTYDVKPHTGRKYKNVWTLDNVKDRTAILIHVGNTVDDTEGCILVGTSWGFLDEKLAVLRSRKAMLNLKKILPEQFELRIEFM